MCNCNLSSVGLITIADALSSIKTLKTLIVSSNTISDTGAIRIAAVIIRNTSLKHIDMSKCTIQEVGKAIIAQALQQASTKLKHIEINLQHSSCAANIIYKFFTALHMCILFILNNYFSV